MVCALMTGRDDGDESGGTGGGDESAEGGDAGVSVDVDVGVGAAYAGELSIVIFI